MDLIADRGRRVSIEELNTTRLLAHARRQAVERNLDGVLIVDVDSHHYENECYDEFLPFIENEVLRQLVLSGRTKGRQTLMPTQVSFQDMGGRITRPRWRSSWAGPTIAGSPKRRCRPRAGASTRCSACRSRSPTRRCATSRPSGTAAA